MEFISQTWGKNAELAVCGEGNVVGVLRDEEGEGHALESRAVINRIPDLSSWFRSLKIPFIPENYN